MGAADENGLPAVVFSYFLDDFVEGWHRETKRNSVWNGEGLVSVDAERRYCVRVDEQCMQFE